MGIETETSGSVVFEVYKDLWFREYNKDDVSKVLRVSKQDRTRNNAFKLDRFKKDTPKI